LQRLLKIVDHFLCSRKLFVTAQPAFDEAETQAAASLFLFRHTQAIAATEPIDRLLGPILLHALSSVPGPHTLDALLASASIAPLARMPSIRAAAEPCLRRMAADGTITESQGSYAATARTRESANAVTQARRLQEEQALGQFVVDLMTDCPSLSSQECELARQAVKDAVVASFKARGLSMANTIVAEQSIAPDDLTDLFGEISRQADRLKGFDARACFIEAAHKFIVEPNEPQRKYLASISQGYFLYHLAGLDPECSKVRKDLFSTTCWFVDSSVLLPLLARGCHNHLYAFDLFAKLREHKAPLFTTDKLLSEAWRHLEWAIDLVRRSPVGSPEFLAAAVVREGYKQNLFVDGYVRSAAAGEVGTFGDYLGGLLDAHEIDKEHFLQSVTNLGVDVLHPSDIPGFTQEHWGEMEEIKQELGRKRMERGTYRGEFQTESEAEVLVCIHKTRDGTFTLPGHAHSPKRVYFVSQSRALDMVSGGPDVVTWIPEALYRYVSTLSAADIDPALLQQCMLHEYFYAGVSFVDKAAYLRFFGPSVRQARLAYSEERDRYLNETERAYNSKDWDAAFERTPDLEKPFFVTQMGWELARTIEKKAARVTSEAEAKAGRAEAKASEAMRAAEDARLEADAARKAKITAEQETRRLRNANDPRQVRKLQRQAKKRKRKKR